MGRCGTEGVICGVDPGLGTTGYAVLDVRGDRTRLVDAGVCRTDAGLELPDRLVQLRRDIVCVLEEHGPAAVAVEQLYSHYRHPRTSILMGHARGVILCSAAEMGMTVVDFSATRVKRFLTGNGHASKRQVQSVVRQTLNLAADPEPADVADALAIALCCAGQWGRPDGVGVLG